MLLWSAAGGGLLLQQKCLEFQTGGLLLVSWIQGPGAHTISLYGLEREAKAKGKKYVFERCTVFLFIFEMFVYSFLI